MDRSDCASFCSVRRGRRPHGTPRNFMHENRETSETPAVKPDCRSAGEGLGRTARVHVCEESQPRHSTDESFEQRQKIVGGE
jgi:hypothetical protein